MFPSVQMHFFVLPKLCPPGLLLDLDTSVCVDPLGVCHLFLKKVADIIAPNFSINFRRLTRLGSFPECWRAANVTAISKGSPSSDEENYLPVSKNPILSKVSEKLASH